MDCSTPGFPVLHHIPKLTQTHVHWVSDVIQPSHLLSSPSPTKKDLNDPDNHNGVITHLEPDILECKVKGALGSITMTKASGGDGIPAELFQILKDDVVKVLHSVCQLTWKTQQGPQDWKRPVCFHSNIKEGQWQRQFRLPHNCTHFTCQQSCAQNSPSQASAILEPWTSWCSSWF